MTKDELILKGKAKVRGNSDLMLIYINLFKEQFGYKPNCAACTFNNDWVKFTSSNSAIRNVGKRPESNTSFKLKTVQGNILRYRADIGNGLRTYRSYDNKMSEYFAVGFLTYGTEVEISERKKLFDVLPDKFRKHKKK